MKMRSYLGMTIGKNNPVLRIPVPNNSDRVTMLGKAIATVLPFANVVTEEYGDETMAHEFTLEDDMTFAIFHRSYLTDLKNYVADKVQRRKEFNNLLGMTYHEAYEWLNNTDIQTYMIMEIMWSEKKMVDINLDMAFMLSRGQCFNPAGQDCDKCTVCSVFEAELKHYSDKGTIREQQKNEQAYISKLEMLKGLCLLGLFFGSAITMLVGGWALAVAFGR